MGCGNCDSKLIGLVRDLRAERDRYMAEASDRQQEIGRFEAERDHHQRIADEWESMLTGAERDRDALAAQVAALASYVLKVSDHEYPCPQVGKGRQPDCTCDWVELLANLPAAAARYLAADRVANNYMHLKACPDDGAGAYSLTLALAENLHEYRKAAGHG